MKKEMANSKKEYTKPVVLAVTKQNAIFSAGCVARYGHACVTCRGN